MKQFFSQRYFYRVCVALILCGVMAWYSISDWLFPPYTMENVSFQTNIVPDTSNDQPVRVRASLFLPDQAKFPVSAVVIAPSSGGVEAVREIYYARALAGKGIAALVIDSFRSRGVEASLYNQSLLESWQVENDAIAALKFLSGDSRFKKTHIAIMGVSKGGTVAMDSVFKVRRSWAGVKKLAFKAHIAISPECSWTMRSNETTGAAMLFLLAEKDDQTPVKPCLSKVKEMRQAGNKRIAVKVYKGAHHAWEELGRRPVYDAKVENYSKCHVRVEDDGEMVSVPTNEHIPEDWYSWAKDNCMELGAYCCGGSRGQKQRATRDILAFLKRQGF